MTNFTVKWRGDVKELDHGNIGYPLALEGEEGTVWRQHKGDKHPHAVGEVLENYEIVDAVGRSGGTYQKIQPIKMQTSTNGAGVSSGGYTKDPADQRRIAAQASQKVAVDVVRLGLAALTSNDGLPVGPDRIATEVVKVAEKLFTQVEDLSKR